MLCPFKNTILRKTSPEKNIHPLPHLRKNLVHPDKNKFAGNTKKELTPRESFYHLKKRISHHKTASALSI